MIKTLMSIAAVKQTLAAVCTVLLTAGLVAAQSVNADRVSEHAADWSEWIGPAPAAESGSYPALVDDPPVDDAGTSLSDAGDSAVVDAGDGWDPAPILCDEGPCTASCRGCSRCAPTPYGAINRLIDKKKGCWAVRTDALILWRDAPPGRLIVDAGDAPARPFLNANQLQSTAAAGPRFSLFRGNPCTGDAWEATYLRAANFRSQRYLYPSEGPFGLASPAVFGNNQAQNFDQGVANLGSSLQSFEFNRHVCHGKHLRWLAGFRWVQWNEQFTLADQAPGDVFDFYQNTCANDLYGGQIGLDAYLLSLPWLRVDSVLKAGAYYNTAVQNSIYILDSAGTVESQGVSVAGTPASCAFVGELGFTGIVPITDCLDFRFGYFGLWLSGIAQPTQQLSGQTLNLSDPVVGSLNMRGGTLVQGVSLGLEGRW